jgi:hypothetical protein
MPERTPQQLSEPKFLAPFSSCSSCIDTLDDLDWVAASTYAIGPWALGVRSSSTEMDDAIRSVLRAHLIDVEAPANFSALMAGDSRPDGQVQAFNFLYRSSDSLVRTRAPGRLMRALLNYLADFAEPVSSMLRLSATGFVADGRAIITPDTIRFEMAGIESRINASGIQVIDAPVLHLDPESNCIVVPEPALTVDADALAAFERRHPPSGREPGAVPAGRYPIAAWAFTTGAGATEPLSPAQAVAAAAGHVVSADAFGAQEVLEAMARVVAHTPVFPVAWADPAELAHALDRLASGSGS